MTETHQIRVPLCNKETARIPRQADAGALLLYCTGGFVAARIDEDVWKVEPVLEDGHPCVKGYFRKRDLHKFLAQCNFSPISFHSVGWTNGSYYFSWLPTVPSKENHAMGPADVWRNISSNLTHTRTDEAFKSMKDPTLDKMESLLDCRTEPERLAQSISLSLRNLDMSVGQVAQFYNEQLTDLLASGRFDGQRVSTIRDQSLYAYVHSFFLHIGAARDYLAAFIASELGKDPSKIDSMSRLVGRVRESDFQKSKILFLLLSNGFIQKAQKGSDNWEVTGWLGDITELRNEFVHRRPYGQRAVERYGYVTAIPLVTGLYRYVRLVATSSKSDQDVLDLMSGHYRSAATLFVQAAEMSGYNAAVRKITDKDIKSFDLRKGK